MTAPITRPWRRFERRMTGRFTVSHRAPLLQILKAAAAAILTWFVCLWVFPEQLPIFGAIAALLSVQESVDQSLTRGIERVVGVLLGVSVALGAGALFGPQSWLFLAAIIVSMGLGWLLRMTNSSTNQIAISALLMIALGGLSLGYGFERLIETIIGAAIGISINALIVAPVRTTPVHLAIGNLTRHSAQALRRLSEALEEPREREWIDRMMRDARRLQSERDEVHQLLRNARESLRLNPRGPRYRAILGEDDEMFSRLQPIVTQVVGMTRALSDNYGKGLVGVPQVSGMAVELRRAAHDLERLGHPSSEPLSHSEPPALTAPYVISQPHPVYWQLIGSLMEDLRRVRGRITGEIE
ncbi:FUSC family protein [Leucobacter sp. W1153]|uniref:FUSC family protein n=1 Tax=Leucobacter sp. W1153 TaxID=3439064 RepID=UPI003F34279A